MPKCQCWEKGFQQGEMHASMEQKQCMQGFTTCSLERCQICLRKEAGGVCVSITHLKSEVCEEVLESARPLGNMSYSSEYMFIVVSWRALVVSHRRDLIRQGRWLVSKFKGIHSSAITSKPTNGGKTRLLGGWCWAGLWLYLISQTVIWWPSHVLLCVCLPWSLCSMAGARAEFCLRSSCLQGPRCQLCSARN